MLSVAGKLMGSADFYLFDFLNRTNHSKNRDAFGRGHFISQDIEKPLPLKDIPRKYHRFGLERETFQSFLLQSPAYDFVLVQTMMTYWYPGVAEVIEDIRKFSLNAKIVLGGPYATICSEHAKSLGADLVLKGEDLDSLWKYIGVEPDMSEPAMWQLYDELKVGAIKITTGCPCKCTYCFVPKYFPKFSVRSVDDCVREIELMVKLGAGNIAFYDDALLYRSSVCLEPVLNYIIENSIKVNLHTPNAMHAKLIKPDLVKLMVKAGFKTFYLGYESSSEDFQKATGGKLDSNDLANAVEVLLSANVDKKNIVAYEILGHPDSKLQNLEASMRFANSLGIKIMLADFSPIPGTIDGDACGRFVDLEEPLFHNKTAFPYYVLGKSAINKIKQYCKQLNKKEFKRFV